MFCNVVFCTSPVPRAELKVLFCNVLYLNVLFVTFLVPRAASGAQGGAVPVQPLLPRGLVPALQPGQCHRSGGLRGIHPRVRQGEGFTSGLLYKTI